MFDSSDNQLNKSNPSNPEFNHKLFTDGHNLSSPALAKDSQTLDLSGIHKLTHEFSEKETKASFEHTLSCLIGINNKYSNLPTEYQNNVMQIAKELNGSHSLTAFLEAKTTTDLRNSMTNFLKVNQA